ncbi:MAG TPA: hypothetical protein VFR26_05125, partial [Acidimicrobiales bacterium]|nr:hypothetical protein [Acidimicrobiales bacterium]
MTRAELRGPRARDRVVVFLAQLLARAFFRSVEVVGAPPPGGRVILAASHLNGFVAASDCERCRPKLVTQPANTASSLTYVAAGAAALA